VSHPTDPSGGLSGADIALVERLIRDSPHAIALTIGPEHTIRSANASFCRLMSVTVAEALGRPFRDLRSEAGASEPTDLLDRVYRNGNGERETELGLEQAGTGRMVWSYTAWPWQTDDRVAGAIVQISDRTEQAHARRRLEEMAGLIREINERLLTAAVREQELAEKAEKAEAASLAKTEYVQVVSRELRTPLARILGYADVLESEAVGALTPLQRESVRRIKRCADALANLIDDVLTFGRMDTTDLALAVSRAMAPRGDEGGPETLPGEPALDQLDLPGTTAGEPPGAGEIMKPFYGPGGAIG
jgi:signal transduction histidine kinase